MADKFLLIDGSSLIHRAFFALPPLVNKNGVNTGAVYGLCNMLLKLIEDVNPKYMAVAFDKSRKTFRTLMYPDYKGQRKPTPPELGEQFPLSMKVLDAIGIKNLELDDYEADDIIGTFAKHAPADVEVIVVTGDKDELQLIDKRTKVYYTKRGITDIQIFDEAEFAEVYEGLVPKQLIELKGLMGDASDNIPGVPGVGPKTALKLIKEYGDVETVLENIDKVNGKSLKQKLAENKESALLSKKLATIYLEAPVDLNIDAYALCRIREEAQPLLKELEFRNMYERFAAVLGGNEDSFDLFGELVDLVETPKEELVSDEQARDFFAKLKTTGQVISFAVKTAGTIPELYFDYAELYFEDKLYTIDTMSSAWDAFMTWLSDEASKKATANAKDIYKVCLCSKKEVKGIVDDVAIAAYLVDAGLSSYEVKDLADRYLNNTFKNEAENIALLIPVLREQLALRAQVRLYEELELPLTKVLAEMENIGIVPDTVLLDQLNEDMTFRIANLEKQAYEVAGEEFNIKSTKQLGVLLFEKLGLPVQKKTKTGYSTDAKVLEALKGEHPIINIILEHRKLAKLQSTYLEGLRPLVNPKTARIHTTFQQTVTVTGRLSSVNPNLQNIPTRTEEGKEIRRIFVPGDGFDYLMSCDYSQVELRILACIAQDHLLIDSFKNNQDVHARTASEVFGVSLDAVTKSMRSRAKAVNFGIVYGISDFGLATQLDVSRKEAQGYIDSYFARYTGVKEYMTDIVAKARMQGYVSTLMGRRRYLPDIKHSNFNLRSFAERTAINTPIQGTAADIMKLAMLKVDAALKEAGLKSRILLQVHDELVLEVPENEKEQAANIVKTAMENAYIMEIPLEAEVAFGKNWAEAK
ncbi:MAG: DNA polymerase I [Phascolarctobacterium sp.]|nr:DNA polymerase I [Phascolarctobacterium sp.]